VAEHEEKTAPGPPSEAAIIGCGPAGLMAATLLAEAGVAVRVFDAMPAPARKFLVAGRGGLNLSNAEEPASFAARYGENAPVFSRLLALFSPADLQKWLHGLGVETFVGTSGRIFPKEASAAEILEKWLTRLRGLGVLFHFQHRWLGFDQEQTPLFRDPQGALRAFPARVLLLALGGASWPKTGSDGAWAKILREQGIRVTEFVPANCGINVAWSDYFRERFSGSALKNLSLHCGDRQGMGEAIITRHGLEGGGVYPLVPALRRALAQGKPACLVLDLKRDLSLARLEERLGKARPGESLANHLRKSLGLAGPIPSLLRELYPPETLADPRLLALAIKGLAVPVTGLRPLAEAISTAGGIAMEEIDEELMLRKLPGVFTAGEMLDWEAPTGGYLLQGAFATGYAAGQGMLRRLREEKGGREADRVE